MKRAIVTCSVLFLIFCLTACESVPVWKTDNEDLVSESVLEISESAMEPSITDTTVHTDMGWVMTVDEPFDMVTAVKEAVSIPPRAEMNTWYEILGNTTAGESLSPFYLKCESIEPLDYELSQAMSEYGMIVPGWDAGKVWVIKYHAYFPGLSDVSSVDNTLKQVKAWVASEDYDVNNEENEASVLYNVENFTFGKCVEFYMCFELPVDAEKCELLLNYGMYRTYMGFALN